LLANPAGGRIVYWMTLRIRQQAGSYSVICAFPY
jgi:hypothetical protein